MSKLLKIIGRSAGISAEWILILFLILAFAIRTYPVQTFIAQKTAAYLSNELKAEIKSAKNLDKNEINKITEELSNNFKSKM